MSTSFVLYLLHFTPLPISRIIAERPTFSQQLRSWSFRFLLLSFYSRKERYYNSLTETTRNSLDDDSALFWCHIMMASTPKPLTKRWLQLRFGPFARARAIFFPDVISRKVNAFATLIVDCVCHVLMCHNIFAIVNSVFIASFSRTCNRCSRLLLMTKGKKAKNSI